MKSLNLFIIGLFLTATSIAQQSTDIQLSKFSKIKVDGIATIYLSQDSAQSVKSSGNSNFSNELIVKDETLIIDNVGNNALYITLPLLDKIEVDGKCDVIAKPFSAEKK